MTSEARRIGALLTEGTDLAAAALLVAIFRDGYVSRQAETFDLFETLELVGCNRGISQTPFGSRGAMLLLANGPLQAAQGQGGRAIRADA